MSSVCICKKCNEVYKQPLLLPCLHTFCKGCTNELEKTVSSKVMIYCPVCNDTLPLPSEGVDSFPPNLHVEHEANISRYASLMKKKPPPPCDECTRDPAMETVSFCCTCSSFLCQHCHLQHLVSRKSYLNHKTLTLKDTNDVETQLRENLITSPAKNKKCPQHANEEIKLHCSQCKVLTCIQCALTQHSGHALEDLSIFINREKKEIGSKMKEMPSVIQKLEELINSGKVVCENIKSQKETIDDEITKLFVKLQQSLDERKADLLKQSSEIATTKITSQDIQNEELASLKAIIMCIQSITDSINEYSESEFLSIVATLETRISNVKEKIDHAQLNLSEDSNVDLIANSSSITDSLSAFEVVSAHRPRDYTKLGNPTTIKTSNAYHLAIHKSGDIIVAYHTNHAVEIYNNTGIKKCTFGCNGHQPGQFNLPLGVAVVGDVMYIVEYSGKRCQKMTVGGECLGTIGSGRLQNPWGCAVSETGVLYIAEEGSNQVQAFNPDGSTLCSIPSGSKPRDVAIDQQGNIHVAASGSKCIKVFGPSGSNHFIREYGNGILSEPSGLAIDQHGFCLVGDWSGRSLHVFEPSGKHIHKVQCNGNICGVATDDKYIYAVDHSSQLIYKYTL